MTARTAVSRLFRFLTFAALLAALLPAAAQAPATQCAERAPRGSDRSFVAAVARNAPAVVGIVILRPRRDPAAEAQGFDFFQSMSGVPLPDAPAASTATQERSTASGFVYSADGHILTSGHAIYDAREIWVITADGRRLPAALVGMDRASDIAVLKVDAPGLPVVTLANPPRICAGDRVAALGEPFGFEGSVTAGVISAYPRFLQGGSGMPLIQTDVAINPGSSGGPLFGADGAVTGMNSMIFSASGIYIGVSFALPIDRVLKIAAQLRAGGAGRGEIGVRTQPVSSELAQAFGLDQARGVLVVRVTPGGPAVQAGLRVGDIVLPAGRGRSAASQDMEEVFAAARPGTTLPLQVWRQRRLHEVTVQVGGPPPDPQAARERRERQRLGLTLVSRTTTGGLPAGAWVESAAGASLLAGIEPGDQITAVNGIEIAGPADFDAALEAAQGPIVALLVTRGSVSIYLAVSRHRD